MSAKRYQVIQVGCIECYGGGWSAPVFQDSYDDEETAVNAVKAWESEFLARTGHYISDADMWIIDTEEGRIIEPLHDEDGGLR